jgi:hypothetical protein
VNSVGDVETAISIIEGNLVSVKDAAIRIGMSEMPLRNAIRDGDVSAIVVFGRTLLYDHVVQKLQASGGLHPRSRSTAQSPKKPKAPRVPGSPKPVSQSQGKSVGLSNDEKDTLRKALLERFSKKRQESSSDV